MSIKPIYILALLSLFLPACDRDLSEEQIREEVDAFYGSVPANGRVIAYTIETFVDSVSVQRDSVIVRYDHKNRMAKLESGIHPDNYINFSYPGDTTMLTETVENGQRRSITQVFMNDRARFDSSWQILGASDSTARKYAYNSKGLVNRYLNYAKLGGIWTVSSLAEIAYNANENPVRLVDDAGFAQVIEYGEEVGWPTPLSMIGPYSFLSYKKRNLMSQMISVYGSQGEEVVDFSYITDIQDRIALEIRRTQYLNEITDTYIRYYYL